MKRFIKDDNGINEVELNPIKFYDWDFSPFENNLTMMISVKDFELLLETIKNLSEAVKNK